MDYSRDEVRRESETWWVVGRLPEDRVGCDRQVMELANDITRSDTWG